MTDDTQPSVNNGAANVLKWAGAHQRYGSLSYLNDLT